MAKTNTRGADKVLHQAEPFSLQAERAIIGAALEDAELTHSQLAGSLLPDHFHDPFCKLAYSRFLDLVEVGNSPDIVLLAASMEGYVSLSSEQIQEELGVIYDTFPSSSNLSGWMGIIHDRYLQREISNAGNRLQEIAHAQDLPPETKLSQAMTLLTDIQSSVAKQETASTMDIVIHTLARIEERAANPDAESDAISYGFDEIDDLTTGMHGGELIILAARPGMGKTAKALSISKATAAHRDPERRKTVLFYSLEMPHEQMGMRWLADLADVSLMSMRSGNVSPQEWARLQDQLELAPGYKFEIDKKPSVTVEQICSDARKIHRERGLGLIVVDYLQLISDSGGFSNRSEFISHVSRSLKNLARELRIPVVALSQLNRELEKRPNKRPVMSDLRESGAIEQDADVIMFLYRDVAYNKSTPEPDVCEVIIGKQRNGSANETVKLGFHGPTTRFYSRRDGAAMSTRASVARAFGGDPQSPF